MEKDRGKEIDRESALSLRILCDRVGTRACGERAYRFRELNIGYRERLVVYRKCCRALHTACGSPPPSKEPLYILTFASILFLSPSPHRLFFSSSLVFSYSTSIHAIFLLITCNASRRTIDRLLVWHFAPARTVRCLFQYLLSQFTLVPVDEHLSLGPRLLDQRITKSALP